ncbi:UNVERIFIED_CONTAM: hypothetical protein GTU68_007880 [Idotea baltica]|nr:hypothetical protein [Idotea baltica]
MAGSYWSKKAIYLNCLMASFIGSN